MTPIPYGFSPIDTSCSIHDAPLWRDGSSNEPRLSGELLVTLTALTPLIVGNHQQKLDDRHSLLVPQMLEDGRVLIGAAGLKGMLRSALSSLLQAPMERVTEHHYTYRPNLAGSGRVKEIRAAVVLPPAPPSDSLQVALLDPKEVVFLPQPIWNALSRPSASSELARSCTGLKFSGEDDGDKKAAFRKKIIVAKQPDGSQDRNARVTLSHTVLSYAGGMDGEGLFASAFDEKSKTYRHVLYPTDKLQQARRHAVTIAPAVVRQYHKTQEILADERIGHLSSGHPLASKIDKNSIRQAIDAHTRLEAWQLIYVEYDSSSRQVTSFGHHYQYRWAYTSSTTTKAGKKRREVDWLPEESRDVETGQPKRLASHRLLFGYTLEGGDEGPATGNFKRLAGRIAFNTAIEDPENKTLAERFMEGGQEIQLRVLGMPRPSAVEFYLKQTALPRKLTTYGDLPGEPGGDLAGRKFYRHQPDVGKSGRPYSPSHAEKQDDANTEERGNCVRYLSRPGSRFRCTLRFDSLRPWELGALLAALDPGLVESTFGLPKHPHGYAHKLGYGKPLGLGSVRLSLDAARWQECDSWIFQHARSDEEAWTQWVQRSLLALKDKLQADWSKLLPQQLESWLQPRQWKEHGRAAYPLARTREKNKQTNRTEEVDRIYAYHTALRRDHAAARRGDDRKNFNELKKLLESGT